METPNLDKALRWAAMPTHLRNAAAEELAALKAECERLHAEIAKLEALENYWVWEGSGEDHLESLTCPVLIRPRQLAELIANPPDTTGMMERIQNQEATIKTLQAEITKLESHADDVEGSSSQWGKAARFWRSEFEAVRQKLLATDMKLIEIADERDEALVEIGELQDRFKSESTEHQAIIDKLSAVRRECFPNKPCEDKG